MTYKRIIVRSLPEFVDKILDFSGKDEVWYRGHKENFYPLEPTAFRSKEYRKNSSRGDKISLEIAKKEMLHISDTKNLVNKFDWYCYMQHVGVPTKLLDWTIDFKIALYFAFENFIEKKSTGGSIPCIWAIKPNDIKSKYICYKSPIVSERVKRQEGCFVEFPPRKDKDDKKRSSFYLESYIASKPKLFNSLAKFIFITPNILLKELSVLNLNKSRIYPEVENIAKEIKNKYFHDIK